MRLRANTPSFKSNGTSLLMHQFTTATLKDFVSSIANATAPDAAISFGATNQARQTVIMTKTNWLIEWYNAFAGYALIQTSEWASGVERLPRQGIFADWSKQFLQRRSTDSRLNLQDTTESVKEACEWMGVQIARQARMWVHTVTICVCTAVNRTTKPFRALAIEWTCLKSKNQSTHTFSV